MMQMMELASVGYATRSDSPRFARLAGFLVASCRNGGEDFYSHSSSERSKDSVIHFQVEIDQE